MVCTAKKTGYQLIAVKICVENVCEYKKGYVWQKMCVYKINRWCVGFRFGLWLTHVEAVF